MVRFRRQYFDHVTICDQTFLRKIWKRVRWQECGKTTFFYSASFRLVQNKIRFAIPSREWMRCSTQILLWNCLIRAAHPIVATLQLMRPKKIVNREGRQLLSVIAWPTMFWSELVPQLFPSQKIWSAQPCLTDIPPHDTMLTPHALHIARAALQTMPTKKIVKITHWQIG